MKRYVLGLVFFLTACAHNDNGAYTDTSTEPDHDYLVGVDEKVAGRYLHEYANMWWQWAHTMSNSSSPVRDQTGEKCQVNQFNDVWFLAGGYGTAIIRRQCVIPEGQYIFFPVINRVFVSRTTPKVDCQQAKNNALLHNDRALRIQVSINGQNIPEARQYRFSSDACFDLYGLIPERFNAPTLYPAATDGYWMMLKPLPKGTHTLKFSAHYQRRGRAFNEMVQDIEYEIEVR